MYLPKFCKFFARDNFLVALLWLVIYSCSSGVCRTASLFGGDVLDQKNVTRRLGGWNDESKSCASNEFACESLSCIEGSKMCDGIRDCEDGSDEAYHECEFYSRRVPASFSREPTSAGKIRRRRAEAEADNRCDVPGGPEMTVVITDDSTSKKRLNLARGSKAPRFSKLEVTCNSGYALLKRGQTYQRGFCHVEEGWIPSLEPCIKTCPPLKPVNAKLTCYYGDAEIPCTDKPVSGTRVEPQCKPFYSAQTTYHELRCQENGNWDQELYKCIPTCGSINELDTFIFGGTKTSIEQSPWNVAVYQISSKYILICGGTLISPRMVVSAAHCFYDQQSEKALNATDYEIVVSKYARNYNVKEEFQRIHKIRRLKIHENFDPRKSGHYGFDVAVIVLEEPVALSSVALPACVDWGASSGFAPDQNASGRLVGWGLVNQTNDGKVASENLLAAELPFISYRNCVGKLSPLPTDQFCAGSESGPGARKGDSGAGLIFFDRVRSRYYLRGVVSSGKKDSWAKPSSVAAFTDISFYLKWLEKERKAVEREQALEEKRSTTTEKPYEYTTSTSAPELENIEPEIPSAEPVCVANGKSCQPDGSLGYCCSGYCHKELGWASGRCVAKQATVRPSTPVDSGICSLHSDANGTITLTDALGRALDLAPGAKVPENSKIKITCKTGYAMANGNEALESVCSRADEGWVPTLMYCLMVEHTNEEQSCVANKKDCQPDGSLGYCCSGYCHKEFGWVTGKCRAK